MEYVRPSKETENMNSPEWLQCSMAKPLFKVRLLLAIILIPAAPSLVLWLDRLGEASGEWFGARFVEIAMQNPWVLVALAAVPPAILIGWVVSLISKPKQENEQRSAG